MSSVSGSGGNRGGNSGEKRGGREKREYRKGVKLRKYTLQEKKEMVQMMNNGARTCDIMRKFNCPESTVRSVRKNKENLAASVKVFSRFPSARTLADTSQRNRLLAIMEHYLNEWVIRRDREKGDLSGPAIRSQARLYFDSVCRKKNVNPPPHFAASVGWLAAFKKRYEVKYALKHGESRSADEEAARTYPEIFQRLVTEGGYSRDQIFNCDETGIYWKRAPKSTLIAKNERQARGVKPSKDRITVLFTANASGDCLMKPQVIYRSAKPRAYRNCNMNQLNVYWASNKKAWVTSALCTDWFDNHFVPDAQSYCKRKNLDFKVLLCIDNAPGHGKFLIGRHPNVEVVFLPPNTTSLLQPLDKEFICNVKLFYYQSLYDDMRVKIDSLQELERIKAELSLAENKQCYSVTRLEVLLGEVGTAVRERQQEATTLSQTVEAARLIPAPGFSAVEASDLQEIIGIHQEEATIKEMLEEDEAQDDPEEDGQQEQNVQPGEPTTGQLTEILTTFSRLTEQLEEYDRRPYPRSILQPSLDQVMNIYKDLYMSRVNARHQSLITGYFSQSQAANALANVTAEPGEDEEDVDDLLGLLQEDDIALDFDGFEAEVALNAGGDAQTVEEGASSQ
ncbi:tigger transposable element-derived protein 1-like [Portunus trituberculatus]|uniref:tigger transposable element-derived protein 1-like n=1 Tax=Portunus trituberculatus TaxID=210409 RepID=UPI001E1CBA88|nr:tigger transposable element-derived protein 1-like [Portunus trituberculatus]